MGSEFGRLGEGMVRVFNRFSPTEGLLHEILFVTREAKFFFLSRRDYPVKRFAVVGDDLYDASGPFIYRTLEDQEGKNPVAAMPDMVNDLAVLPKRPRCSEKWGVVDDRGKFDDDADYRDDDILYCAVGNCVYEPLKDPKGENPVAERRDIVTDLICVGGVLYDSAGGLRFKTLGDYYGTDPVGRKFVVVDEEEMDFFERHRSNELDDSPWCIDSDIRFCLQNANALKSDFYYENGSGTLLIIPSGRINIYHELKPFATF